MIIKPQRADFNIASFFGNHLPDNRKRKTDFDGKGSFPALIIPAEVSAGGAHGDGDIFQFTEAGCQGQTQSLRLIALNKADPSPFLTWLIASSGVTIFFLNSSSQLIILSPN